MNLADLRLAVIGWVREKIPHFVLMTNFAMAFLILWQNGSFLFLLPLRHISGKGWNSGAQEASAF